MNRLLPKISGNQKSWITQILRNETFGGSILLIAAITALILANSPLQGWFFTVKNYELGFDFLTLPVGTWVADGLLVIFFLAAGIELKHELVHGSLKQKSQALVPIAAAVGGMVVPASIYLMFNFGRDTGSGWGIPMATDIAFALAILAVVGRKLPIELRAFLLTLAVVDDLGAIVVIAIFYTSEFVVGAFLAAIGLLCLFGFLQKKGVKGWYFYLPLGLASWYLMHESGVHATVAGIAMGLLMNMNNSAGENLLRVIHPYSTILAAPLFAFFASGISIGQIDINKIPSSTLSLGVIFGLVIGKPIGVFLGAYLVAKFSRAELSRGISWWDVAAVGSLAGVGFTVALLIGELAFKESESYSQLSVFSVLLASLISALLASILLTLRNRSYLRKSIG
jgi:NhaA family Na+:H+ antiporter